MKQQEKPKGILILGLLLVISGLIFQCSFWLPIKGIQVIGGNSQIYKITYPVISKLVMDPLELFLSLSMFSREKILFFSLIRTMALIFCGIGIIRLSNIARLGLVGLVGMKILPFLLLWPMAEIVSFQKTISLILPLIYLTYLMHPKVSKWFN